MDNGYATWIKPVEGIKLPEMAYRRFEVLDRAAHWIDEVAPDYDISTEPRNDNYVPVSTDAFGGYGGAVLTAAAETPAYAVAPNAAPAESLAPVRDDPRVRQAAVEDSYKIDLTKPVEDELDTAYWRENVLDPSVLHEAPAPTNAVPMPHTAPPATPPPFNPLANWGVAPPRTDARQDPAPNNGAQILQFPLQTAPEAITHRLHPDYVAKTVENAAQPLVVAPQPESGGFWAATNPESSAPASPEEQDQLARARAARDALARLHTTQPQAGIMQHLTGAA